MIRSLACTVLLCSLSACSLFKAATPKQMLYLRVETDKQIYRPGEMVLAKAEIINVYDEPLTIETMISSEEPKKSNLNFRQMKSGAWDFARKSPVVMTAPRTVAGFLMANPIQLEPGESTTEKFAFVNLTENSGPCRLWTEYTAKPSSPSKSKRALKERKNHSAVTSVSEFSVEGPRLWKREHGIIVYDEALKIAKAKYGKDVKDVKGILTENKKNLLVDWWVTIEKKPEDVKEGESPFVAYFISPYGAFVRKSAPPFSMDPTEFLMLEAQSSKKGNRAPQPAMIGITKGVKTIEGSTE